MQAACILQPQQRAMDYRDEQENSSGPGKALHYSCWRYSAVSSEAVTVFLHYRTGLALTVPEGLTPRVSLVLRTARGRDRQHWTGFQPILGLTQAALWFFSADVTETLLSAESIPYFISDWLRYNSCNNGARLCHWQDADSFQMANDGLKNSEIWEHLKSLSSVH